MKTKVNSKGLNPKKVNVEKLQQSVKDKKQIYKNNQIVLK